MLRFALLAAVVAAACSHDDRSARTSGPAAADAAGAAAPTPRPRPTGPPAAVVLAGAAGEIRIEVELAIEPARRSRGLMYRDYLPPDRGMLFVFERDEPQSFWMKNTLIPLDIIFIHSDLTVAGVVEDAEPMTTTSRKVDAPSRFVLEVNAGWARAHGVGAGTRVRFENVPVR